MNVEKINEERKKRNLSVAELAKRANLPKGTVEKVLFGIVKHPRIDTMQAIEKGLGLSSSSILASAPNTTPVAFENMPELLFEKRFLDIAKIYHKLTDEYREKILTVVTVIALSVGLDIEQVLETKK